MKYFNGKYDVLNAIKALDGDMDTFSKICFETHFSVRLLKLRKYAHFSVLSLLLTTVDALLLVS